MGLCQGGKSFSPHEGRRVFDGTSKLRHLELRKRCKKTDGHCPQKRQGNGGTRKRRTHRQGHCKSWNLSNSSDLRSGCALEQDADGTIHIVFILRVAGQLFPDRCIVESLPMLFVRFQIFTTGHVNQTWHSRTDQGSAVKNRRQANFF